MGICMNVGAHLCTKKMCISLLVFLDKKTRVNSYMLYIFICFCDMIFISFDE